MTRIGSIIVPVLTMALASCVPWTIRPIEAESKEQPSGASHGSNPAAYVDSVWTSRLVPAVTTSAVDARVLLDAISASPTEARARYGRHEGSGPTYFIVKGRGLVTAVDMRSRVGLALVDVAPFDGRADVTIQIGPVIRGTSLRDATGIVRFSDFINQLQFADAGIAMNNRVLKTVLAPLDVHQLKGRRVTFAGTAAAAENSSVRLTELVPLVLSVEASR